MRVFHLLIPYVCPIKRDGLCRHQKLDDYDKCAFSVPYNLIVDEAGEVWRDIYRPPSPRLVDIYIGYIGQIETPGHRKAMRDFVLFFPKADNVYGKGLTPG